MEGDLLQVTFHFLSGNPFLVQIELLRIFHCEVHSRLIYNLEVYACNFKSIEKFSQGKKQTKVVFLSNKNSFLKVSFMNATVFKISC